MHTAKIRRYHISSEKESPLWLTFTGERTGLLLTEKNQKLLRFLRDELHLTSVKDGCSEGACGACTVIIDGKTCKACVPDTDSLGRQRM